MRTVLCLLQLCEENEKRRGIGKKTGLKKEKEKTGGEGYRSPYLSHAKRALYHLSYTPFHFWLPTTLLESDLWLGYRVERKSDLGVEWNEKEGQVHLRWVWKRYRERNE